MKQAEAVTVASPEMRSRIRQTMEALAERAKVEIAAALGPEGVVMREAQRIRMTMFLAER